MSLFVFACTVLFVSISQVIGCEDRLRNGLYCVGWGVKLYSIQKTLPPDTTQTLVYLCSVLVVSGGQCELGIRLGLHCVDSLWTCCALVAELLYNARLCHFVNF